MNIFEFCEKFNLSLPKARKMLKAGVLRLDENTPEAVAEIRFSLSRGQRLTAAQMAYLAESPNAIGDMGRYAAKAQSCLDEIRDASGRIVPAPEMVSAYISDASRGDHEAVSVLVDYIRDILPRRPVPHSYIAVRLLLGLDISIREYDVPRVPRALYHCRQHEDFIGWWYVGKAGKRTMTIYHRPSKNPLANLDL